VRSTGIRQRAVVALLHTIHNRYALARNPLAARFGDVDRLPSVVESLVEELGAESEQQRRRFDVLRRGDIRREAHAVIAREMGLSRSQFYRDLREAREQLACAIDVRLGLPEIGTPAELPGDDARFAAIGALRDGGRFARAHDVADGIVRECSDGADAIRALCIRAEIEVELGFFFKASASTRQARVLLANVPDRRASGLLEATCDLVEFEASHCSGEPASSMLRSSLLDRLRGNYRSRDRAYALLLVRALVAEASILFERDEALGALAIVDEASSIVTREGLESTRLAADVAIRSSGIRALHADRVTSALEEATAVARTGRRCGDVRTLRLGVQMMAAHLLTLGRLDEARHFALQAQSLIELFGSPLDRLIVLSNLARIEIHRRDGRRALEWIELAHAVPCAAFSIVQALAITKAEALVLIGQPARAAVMARSLGERLQSWPRLIGRAKLAEAGALAALERVREARACSEEAVACSRGTAGPLLHMRALDLNVKLTGSARAMAALHELQNALNA
jgi:hypothetical protein